MQQATQITLRNVKRSTIFARRVRDKCEALERFHPHILNCRVTLEQDTSRPGTARPYTVTLHIAVPGEELVVNHTHRVDPHLALRDAFAIMRRRLQDAAAIARREVKAHSQPVPETTP